MIAKAVPVKINPGSYPVKSKTRSATQLSAMPRGTKIPIPRTAPGAAIRWLLTAKSPAVVIYQTAEYHKPLKVPKGR